MRRLLFNTAPLVQDHRKVRNQVAPALCPVVGAQAALEVVALAHHRVQAVKAVVHRVQAVKAVVHRVQARNKH